MAVKSSVEQFHISFTQASCRSALALLVLFVLSVFLSFAPRVWAQTVDPKSPSKEYIRLGGRVIAIENGGETVSAPSTPAGPATGVTGTLYMFQSGGSVSNKGHKVQYSFNWGDGSASGWTPPGVSLSFHQWSAPGTYSVTVLARCTTDINVFSVASSVLTVTITGESISTPSKPSGPATGSPNTSYTFSTGNSTSSLGHQVQYKFIWDDGSTSGWLPVGTTSASHSWPIARTYNVTALARCATDTAVVSASSDSLSVTISGAGETISTPAINGPATGIPSTSYTYLVSGATSSLGHPIQYRINWGDGSATGFLPVGTTSASHAWTNPGTYTVTVQAHCSADISVVSDLSSFTVTISDTVPPIAISGLNFTNQNGTAITMPAPAGTTAINAAWNTNINANCTYGGFAANANGGTSGHFVTRSPLTNGFSEAQTVTCTDVNNSSNSTSTQVSIAIQNSTITISGLNFTNQNGTAITMPAPAGTTALNVAWNTNINANCTYGGVTANANGGTSGHFVTRSPLTNGFSETQTIVCTDVASSANTTSIQVSIGVQNLAITISGLNFTNQNGTAITMPAPVGTTAINVAWNTNINANCTYGGFAANANGGTSGHFVTRSPLTNGFSETQTIVCTDVSSSSNTTSTQVSIAVQNPAMAISGLNFTNQNGTAITMPAPVGTTAINVAWNTNINANCTYGGFAANANGGTSGHFVTRSPLTNGFSETQTIVCTDVASSSNTASTQVSISVLNPPIAISGVSFTNQNGTAITMPAPVGTTAINVVWNTNINANCTYGGFAANANGGTSGHFVTRSPLTNGFSETQTVACNDVANAANSTSTQVSIAVQNPPISISGVSFTNQNGTAITMPAPVGTTAINVVWNTNINANCTYGGFAANANGGTSGHFVTRSPLTNGFSETQTVACNDVANAANSTSTQVSIAVQNPPISISGISFTNQNGTAITMPAPAGTTAINVAWNTNINANCTYGGFAANANGGTSGHFVTRSPLSNGFSETQTITCTDVASTSNATSTQVSIAVQNSPITISGVSFANQNGTAITMPAPAGTTAINVVWNTNINANCTYGGFTANANGGTSGHFVTRSPLSNGFSETQTIVCIDVASTSNNTSTQVSISVQNPPISISGISFTNQNGTAIIMPAPAGTTAINVVWNTNINANCTYGGFTANANGGTSGHFVTRSPLSNGFSETQTIVCIDVASTSNNTSTQVSISVQNPPISISGISFTNQNGTAITMPAPAGTTAINVAWNTNINANCTYGGFTANANGGTSGHFVTRSPLSNGFSETQTIVCSDVANPSNSTSTQVSISIQNPPLIAISGVSFTNQNGTPIGMPAAAGTTAINVVWNTNVNANCTYGGFTANANGGTSGHFVTRSPLSNGFSETQTIACTDVSNTANSTSTSVSIAVSN